MWTSADTQNAQAHALVIEERKSPTLHQQKHATQMFEDAQKLMMRSKQNDLSHLTQASGKWNVLQKNHENPIDATSTNAQT